MDGLSGQKPAVVWLLNISVIALTLLWLFPTLGLFVSSFRTSEQITASGWWSAMFASEQTVQLRLSDPDDFRFETTDGVFVVQGTVFGTDLAKVDIDSWGTSSRDLDAYGVGETADLGDGEILTLNADGTYVWQGDDDQISGRAQRVFINATVPPEFSGDNYAAVLGTGVIGDLLRAAWISAIVGFVALKAFARLMPTFTPMLATAGAVLIGSGTALTIVQRFGFADIKYWMLAAIVCGAASFFFLVTVSKPSSAKYYGWGFAVACFVMILIDYGLGTGEGAKTASEDMGKAFLNTLTVVIPATIIPILIAAYALAWMDFPGRALLIAIVVGLLVVPLQLALIPLLSVHVGAMELLTSMMGPVDASSRLTGTNWFGDFFGMSEGDKIAGKGYFGAWLAHTGFGLPLAIYLLRNYMVGLPRDIIENARVDGATEFQIFTKIILPLSFPALASFAIFQFLWTWNDLLVALVFLIDSSGNTTVMTKQIVELLGTRGGDWEILATSAFVSIAVPLLVFFSMQKYLVRGLLAGSVK